MKQFLILCACVILLCFTGDYLHYERGFYLSFQRPTPSTQTKIDQKTILLKQNGVFEPFEMRGVDMGAGMPGTFATEYAISKEDYLRWFRQISEMGANTLRVYTILNPAFYEAFYTFNQNNPHPLYLIHGLWLNDYLQNSHLDAFDPAFLQPLLQDAHRLVDVIHGKRRLSLGDSSGSGSYRRDISAWVIGYILGVEWEDVTVVYTDRTHPDRTSYQGQYLYTTPEATPFEAMLAQLGDEIIAYETDRYGTQRLIAFSNWPTTDPFDYPETITLHFKKIAKIDVEHIRSTDRFLSGQFVSYHIYPYYPDYYNYLPDLPGATEEAGESNTYLSYLTAINAHHTMPVVISEFGVPSSRGMAQRDQNTGRNQGGLSETAQGEALVSCYRDIKAAGCAGAILFTWQDEWFKRTWNTMHAVDLQKTPYWSDAQTNEQQFGLLTFDPGREKSVCYVDGDPSEWSQSDQIIDTPAYSLSIKYDEKYFYLLARKTGFAENPRFFIPFDITPQTGAYESDVGSLQFTRPADFLLVVDGTTQSRLLVQQRYETLRAVFLQEIAGIDPYENPPAPDTSTFVPIHLILQTPTELLQEGPPRAETYETGLLVYGNANPAAPDFNSLADFCFQGDFVEIRLPWQLLNFSNPSEMKIHDDYYPNYGIESIRIDTLYLGIGDASGLPLRLAPVRLRGWGQNPTYHERLKASYYRMQALWRDGSEAAS